MLKRMLNSQHGIGLAEVMVASALLGGLSLVVMKINEQGSQGVSRVEKGIEAADFDREAISFLAVKSACNQTIGTPTLASISGAIGLSLTQIKNESGTVVLSVGDKRGVVELVSMRIHSYDAATKMASFTKVYRFQLSPGKFVNKTKTSKISILPDKTNTNLSTCIATTAVTDDVWTIDDYGIFYDDKTVFIGKDGSVEASQVKLMVEGNMVSGEAHNIQDGGDFKGVALLGGYGNYVWDFFPASNTPLKNGAIIGGQGNRLYDQRNDLSAYNNVIAGGETNLIDSTNHGFIAGGGLNFIEKTSGIGSVVIGGQANWITGDRSASPEFSTWEVQNRPYGSNVIAAGLENKITRAENSFVGSGYRNSAFYDQNMVVLGGQNNLVSAQDSAIIAGSLNTIVSGLESAATIGGTSNQIGSSNSAIIGGNSSTIKADADNSVILGTAGGIVNDNALRSTLLVGTSNIIEAGHSNGIIIGGSSNTLSSTVGVDSSNAYNGLILRSGSSRTKGLSGMIIGAYYSTTEAYQAGIFNSSRTTVSSPYAVAMGGGRVAADPVNPTGFPAVGNTIGTNAPSSAIVGGFKNTVDCPQCFIGGGDNLSVTGTLSSKGSVLIGGNANTITGSSAGFTAIIAGQNNSNSGAFSSIIGGDNNTINLRAWTSTILGGKNNTIEQISPSEASRSVIVGGEYNTIKNYRSVILGGSYNTIEQPNSLAFGRGAYVAHSGSVILKDDETDILTTQDIDTLVAKFKNGVKICSQTQVSSGISTCTGGLQLDSNGKLYAFGAAPGAPYTGTSPVLHSSAGMWLSSWFVGNKQNALCLPFGSFCGSLVFGTSTAIKMALDNSGNLTILGNLTENGSFSDVRLKKDLKKLENVSEKIKTLNGYSFKYKKDNTPSIGVSAQELEKVYPELVYKTKRIDDDTTEYRAVKYELLSAILIEGFKEQQQEIEKNKEMLETMQVGIEDRVSALEQEIERLKSENKSLNDKLTNILSRLENLENR